MLKNPNYKKPEYKLWSNFIQRCENPKNANYKHYGARGIKVCPRWRNSFSDFFSDVGPRPELGMTLERINNDGNYDPTNVTWAGRITQSNNTRRNRNLTINGVTKTLAEWAREVGIEYGTFMGRVLRGLEGEELLKPTDTKFQNGRTRNLVAQ